MNIKHKKRSLSDLAFIERGRFSARPRNDPQYYGGDIPFLQTGDIARARRTVVSWEQTLNERGLAVSRVFPCGTMFMSIAANIGDVAISTFDAACPDSVVAIAPKSGVDAEWLFQTLQFSKNQLSALSTQNAQANLSLEKIEPFNVHAPSFPEQCCIAAILRTWDEAIEKLDALRVAGERQYSGLADDLIFGRRRNIGVRRNWRHRRLGDVTREVTARNVGGRLGRDAVMGVTKANGIVPMREQTIGADLSRYKVLPPLGFAYNPMRINIGSIALSRLESDVLVSPDYVLFVCEKGKLSPDYLEHLRKTHFWSHHINAGGAGSVRLRIYYDDFAALNLPLPDYDEQLAIVEVLDAARRQIDLTEAEIALLALQKRGLMQKLLTGEWRVKLEER